MARTLFEHEALVAKYQAMPEAERRAYVSSFYLGGLAYLKHGGYPEAFDDLRAAAEISPLASADRDMALQGLIRLSLEAHEAGVLDVSSYAAVNTARLSCPSEDYGRNGEVVHFRAFGSGVRQLLKLSESHLAMGRIDSARIELVCAQLYGPLDELRRTPIVKVALEVAAHALVKGDSHSAKIATGVADELATEQGPTNDFARQAKRWVEDDMKGPSPLKTAPEAAADLFPPLLTAWQYAVDTVKPPRLLERGRRKLGLRKIYE